MNVFFFLVLFLTRANPSATAHTAHHTGLSSFMSVNVKNMPLPPPKVVGIASGVVVALVMLGLVFTGYIGRRIYVNRASVEVANFDFVMSPRGNNSSPSRQGSRSRLNSSMPSPGRSAFQEGAYCIKLTATLLCYCIRDAVCAMVHADQ